MTASVTHSYTNAILHYLSVHNIPLDSDLRYDIDSYNDADRLPMALQDALWQFLDHLGQPAIGLDIGMEMLPQNFDTMGFLLLTSPSLSVAVESLLNYSPLIGEGGTFTRTHTARGWQLCYEPQFTVAVPLRIEAIFASIASGTRWVAGKNITPVSVHFRHRQQAERTRYRQVFGSAALQFESHSNAIVYADSDWHFKQRDVNPAVQAQMLALARQQLAQLKPTTFSEQVSALLTTQPWLSRAQVAASLAMSERTLTRRLSSQGMSFQTLVNTIRKQYALEHICQANVTQASLAEHLGYSDEQAFAKAFRRWTGLGFKAYQRKHCGSYTQP
ncbi:AraC family transcriptional regulator [Alteromonas halophila]|uniref:Transcriptional regulator n=1 Tax=Alteromonas halophila TaxID=516698 RepID=A0A918JQQ6_9ALTE|nr:AraC family transcriptional regulator [Alteromonas halophila]GGW94116.1 transcriptional regulator [Alteromonas halophila]